LIDNPLNVATPFTVLTVAIPLNVPLPGFVPIATVTEAAPLVTVFPPASCTVTTGCGLNSALTTTPTGFVVNASFEAAPTEMLKVLLVASVKPLLDAVSVYPVPLLSIDSPLNVATPLTALAVAVPLNVPLLGFVPIATVIEAVLLVTVLPPASCTVTTGCVPKSVPPVVSLGLVVNASFVAAPTVMLNVALDAPVRPVADAVSV
jgi:hypothetical protein